jgi:hypothetical protein
MQPDDPWDPQVNPVRREEQIKKHPDWDIRDREIWVKKRVALFTKNITSQLRTNILFYKRMETKTARKEMA